MGPFYFLPGPAADGDPSWGAWVPGSGQTGEASGERTGPIERYSLGNLLRLVPLHAYSCGRVRESGGSLYMSGCPGSHDNDKREDSSGGGSGWCIAEGLESGRIARAATEESFGSSPGSSSDVLCLWLLSVP